MGKYFDLLTQVKLFEGIEKENLTSMLQCLGAKVKHFEKGEYIINAEDSLLNIGIMLSGQAQEIKEDSFGKKTIVSMLNSTDMFGEALVCAGKTTSPFSILVTEAADVIFLAYGRIVNVCSNSCGFHSALIQKLFSNLLIALNQHILMIEPLGFFRIEPRS